MFIACPAFYKMDSNLQLQVFVVDAAETAVVEEEDSVVVVVTAEVSVVEEEAIVEDGKLV